MRESSVAGLESMGGYTSGDKEISRLHSDPSATASCS